MPSSTDDVPVHDRRLKKQFKIMLTYLSRSPSLKAYVMPLQPLPFPFHYTTVDTLISDVLTIFTWIPVLAMTANISAATPGLDTIPEPTIETFAKLLSVSTRSNCKCCLITFQDAKASSVSSRLDGKR